MAKWAHADFLDGGLLALKNGAIKMLLVKAYTVADSYATVQGNKVAEATMSSADYTIAASGSNRTLTTATKSATATAVGGAGDHHIVLTDGVSKVLYATDETGEAAVAIGGTVNFPALTYTNTQPT